MAALETALLFGLRVLSGSGCRVLNLKTTFGHVIKELSTPSLKWYISHARPKPHNARRWYAGPL